MLSYPLKAVFGLSDPGLRRWATSPSWHRHEAVRPAYLAGCSQSAALRLGFPLAPQGRDKFLEKVVDKRDFGNALCYTG